MIFKKFNILTFVFVFALILNFSFALEIFKDNNCVMITMLPYSEYDFINATDFTYHIISTDPNSSCGFDYCQFCSKQVVEEFKLQIINKDSNVSKTYKLESFAEQSYNYYSFGFEYDNQTSQFGTGTLQYSYSHSIINDSYSCLGSIVVIALVIGLIYFYVKFRDRPFSLGNVFMSSTANEKIVNVKKKKRKKKNVKNKKVKTQNIKNKRVKSKKPQKHK